MKKSLIEMLIGCAIGGFFTIMATMYAAELVQLKNVLTANKEVIVVGSGVLMLISIAVGLLYNLIMVRKLKKQLELKQAA